MTKDRFKNIIKTPYWMIKRYTLKFRIDKAIKNKDKTIIPNSQFYCYSDDGVDCPYHRSICSDNAYCGYMELSDDELFYKYGLTSLLFDNVKICSE